MNIGIIIAIISTIILIAMLIHAENKIMDLQHEIEELKKGATK
jgi:cell division protein FtsL